MTIVGVVKTVLINGAVTFIAGLLVVLDGPTTLAKFGAATVLLIQAIRLVVFLRE